jgi:hypothetical protein
MEACHGVVIAEQNCARGESDHPCYPISSPIGKATQKQRSHVFRYRLGSITFAFPQPVCRPWPANAPSWRIENFLLESASQADKLDTAEEQVMCTHLPERYNRRNLAHQNDAPTLAV